MTTKYELASSTWDNNEIEAIQGVISRDIYSMSDKVAQFEKDFCSFFKCKYAVMVNSGSTANLLAAAALFSPAAINGVTVLYFRFLLLSCIIIVYLCTM